MREAVNIEVIARGLCIRDGKVLLAYVKSDEYFFLPGGHVEQDESIFHTLEREICEETGLVATAGELVLVFEHSWEGKKGSVHEINFIIACEVSDSTELSSNEPHLDFKWVSVEDLHTIKFLPTEIVSSIRAFAEGKRVPAFLSTLN